MTSTHDEQPARPGGRFTRLPEGPSLEETVETVDADDVPDPHAGRNVDQHRALRDD